MPSNFLEVDPEADIPHLDRVSRHPPVGPEIDDCARRRSLRLVGRCTVVVLLDAGDARDRGDDGRRAKRRRRRTAGTPIFDGQDVGRDGSEDHRSRCADGALVGAASSSAQPLCTVRSVRTAISCCASAARSGDRPSRAMVMYRASVRARAPAPDSRRAWASPSGERSVRRYGTPARHWATPRVRSRGCAGHGRVDGSRDLCERKAGPRLREWRGC